MIRRATTLFALVLFATAAAAHPLPNLRYDRTARIAISPGGVAVRYELDLNDWTMILDPEYKLTDKEIQPFAGQPGFDRKYAEVYAQKRATFLAEGFQATLDGEYLKFVPEKIRIDQDKDHRKFAFEFRAAWSLTAGKSHDFRFEDANFSGRAGALILTFDDPGTALKVLKLADPRALHGKSPLDLTPSEADRLRMASAQFVLVGPPQPVVIPESSRDVIVETTTPAPSLWDDVRNRGLVAIFDSGLGLGLMLLLAGAFGMAHAFTPGHGKTMVAAYLVGERGTIWHAVTLGITATLAHTGSVIAVALVVYGVYGDRAPAEAEGWLMLAGGLLIAGGGLWLFLQRLRGRADHVHLFHERDPKPRATARFGWLRVVLLGLGGGIIPCWDAVLLLLVGITRGRIGVAIPMLFSFSAGLAAVLIGLGIGVVYANRSGGRRFGERRWFQLLPIVTAAILIVLGLWFARDGVTTLSTSPTP